MTLVALLCAVVSYCTSELVTRGTVTPGAGTGCVYVGEGKMVLYSFVCSACVGRD